MLRLSVFPDAFPSVMEQFFSNSKARGRADLEMNANSLRSTLEVVQSSNFRICNSIVRSSPAARERMLAYWGKACDLNSKRAGMRVNAKKVSSDAFMVNLFELAVRFAEPFMDAGFSKVSRLMVAVVPTPKLTELGSFRSIESTWSTSATKSDLTPVL